MAGSPQHATLTAGTVTTLTFDPRFNWVEVVNVDGAAEVYFTADGSTPVVATTGTHVLPAAVGSSLEIAVSTNAATVVKAISAGTPKISARGSVDSL